eukprot:8732310-Pyramimonas_sp.AAC.1
MQCALYRAMVPFTLKMAGGLCDLGRPLGRAACCGMHGPNEFCKALSATSVNGPGAPAENAPKFALFYTSLA